MHMLIIAVAGWFLSYWCCRPFHLFIAPNTIRSVVRGVGSERTLVTVPATVLGRYYMSHQKLLETDHAETVQLANPSLYCSQTHYRPIIQHEQLSESTKRVHIQLAQDEAMLEMTEDGNARVSTQLLLLTAHSYMNGITLSFNCPPLPPHTHPHPTHTSIPCRYSCPYP